MANRPRRAQSARSQRPAQKQQQTAGAVLRCLAAEDAADGAPDFARERMADEQLRTDPLPSTRQDGRLQRLRPIACARSGHRAAATGSAANWLRHCV